MPAKILLLTQYLSVVLFSTVQIHPSIHFPFLFVAELRAMGVCWILSQMLEGKGKVTFSTSHSLQGHIDKQLLALTITPTEKWLFPIFEASLCKNDAYQKTDRSIEVVWHASLLINQMVFFFSMWPSNHVQIFKIKSKKSKTMVTIFFWFYHKMQRKGLRNNLKVKYLFEIKQTHNTLPPHALPK